MPLSRPARLTALTLLAACCAAFAPAPVYREPKAKPDRRTDEDKLQGTWEMVSQSLGGKPVPARPGECAVVFVRGRVTFVRRGEPMPWSLSLDPTASPKRMDLRPVEGRVVGCIYRLEGDRLTLAIAPRRGAAVPTDFKGGPGISLYVYRRAGRGK